MKVGYAHQTRDPARLLRLLGRIYKSRIVRACALMFLVLPSFGFGFWVHRRGLHWPAVRWVDHHTSEQYISRAKRYLNSMTYASPFPTLTIDVKFKHVEKLRRKRQEALDLDMLIASDDDFVPAKLHYEGQDISAKLRLKGDNVDHLQGNKWSFRIRIKGDDHILGMRRFSIQHPKTRNYLCEWGFMKSLRREDILAPRNRFIQVVFNGEDRGIFALEEHFSKELPESQGRREGVIVKADEREHHLNYLRVGTAGGWHKWGFYNSCFDTYRSTRIESDPLLAKQRDEAIGLLRAFQEGHRKPSEVFDVELMGRFMALTELWNAYHTLHWANSRFYFNPITARLEPIGFDATSQFGTFKTGLVWNRDWTGNSPVSRERNAFWMSLCIQDPVMAEIYVRQLQRISAPSYLDAIKLQIGEEMQTLLTGLSREFVLDEALKLPWDDLKARQELFRNVLTPIRMVLAYSVRTTVDQVGEPEDELVEVRNVLDLPVEIVGLQIGDGPILPAQSAWVAQPDDPGVARSEEAVLLPVADQGTPLQYSRFVAPTTGDSSLDGDTDQQTVFVHTRLIGHDRVIRTPVVFQPQAITQAPYARNTTIEEALAKHEFLEQRDGESQLWIKSGTWRVEEDLVIPKGIRLRVGPDTTLRFAENAILVARGPIEFRGTAGTPVILESIDASWPGMVVMKAVRPSILEHVTIRGTRGIARRGWILTGGVTFYKSPVLIKYCHFENSLGEDGLNIIRTEFDLRGTRFSHCASDAFDGDFATGKVQGCEFTDVRADGLDLSGSEVVVAQSVFDQIGDKAISVGERSTARIRSISVSQSRFGVVSKDCSKVSVDRSTFRQVQYGLAAFEKKPEFGPAHLEAHNVRMDRVAKPSLVQTDSTMTIDGKTQPTEHLDVESLYRAAANRKDGGGV